MHKVSKRFFDLKNIIQNNKYSFDVAVNLLKKLSTTKFVETAEAHINLNIKKKSENKNIQSQLIFPHNTREKKIVAVFCDFEDIKTHMNTNIDIFGIDHILKDIESGNIKFDILITTQKYMPILTKYGKILGPKGLMPSIKLGTLTTNIMEAVNSIKLKKTKYKTDKHGIIHICFGKLNFTEIQLVENLKTLYFSVIQNKPSEMREAFINSFYVCTTMSPSVLLDIHSFKN